MKKANLNIGDLVLCKARIDPDHEHEDWNIKLVFGWITNKYINKYNGLMYRVQWSDKIEDGEIRPDDAFTVREFYLTKRKEWGI